MRPSPGEPKNVCQDQSRRHRQRQLRSAGKILRSRLCHAQCAARPRLSGRDRGRRLCRPQHQSAPRRALGRPRPFRHRGGRRRDRVRAPARKLSGGEMAKRPSNRPFAGITTHDPDGNVFDLSQKDMANRAAIYVENDGKPNPRHISHVALRTLRPAEMAKFYRDVFELAPANRGGDDRNHYLTDGHVTLVIMPWEITDYDGTGIITAGMDHIGFKVESVQALKDDVERLAANNPRLAPAPFSGPEGGALEKLFRRSCPLGQYQMADCDGTLIDVFAD